MVDVDQEMLDACDSESELHIKLGLPASSPANGELRNGDAPAAGNQEAVLEVVISVDQTQGVPCTYNIQDGSSFTKFIEDLRNLLAQHPGKELLYDCREDPNLSSTRKYPLLAKPRGDQQPERWIEVQLQVSGQGQGRAALSSSTTLVIRDDNVDVVGFMNNNGDCYAIGNNLPPRYNSKPLAGWVTINVEHVANVLVGKTFVAHAVRVLSCFPEPVVDGLDPRMALVGLSVMVCDSARMNPVLTTIADGWDAGTRFTEKLMTTVGKYEWMSRFLWQWSRRKYANPQPAVSDLQAICLVLNGPPEVVYTIGDEVSFISFMIDLRRMIMGPVRKDILDEHKDRNLSSTHEHPLLPQQRAPHPERWLHVKLQVVDGEETSWTTLIMRGDNLYVNGFMNQQGVYGLVDKNQNSIMVLPNPYMNRPVKRLQWSVEYINLLKAKSNDDLVKKLERAHLGQEFAIEAVRVLSSYQATKVSDKINANLALAGLILMVCESARMNPCHNAFAIGWSTGTGFTKKLMTDYVQNHNYSKKSAKLRDWKDQKYKESGKLPHPIKELQDVYLVLNSPSKPSSSSARTQPGNPPLPHGGNPPPPTSGSTREASTGGGSGGHNQSREAGSNTDSSSGGSASQPGNGGDASTGAGSALQPVDEGHSTLSRGNSGSKTEDAYDHGRPLVEILAIHADLGVPGTKIIVYDGIRGQIIYRKEEEQRKHINEQKEQGEQQGMVELVLTGPYTSISAYGCFAIQIDIPDGAADSSTEDAIEWEWDCYDPEYAIEVDRPPVSRIISSGPGRNVEVIYAVLSNALEATIQVKLWLKNGHSPTGICGEITAHIDCFEEDKGRSVLFRRAKGMGHCFSPTDKGSWLLQLARHVVVVPCGRVLRIEMNLQVETDDGNEAEVKVPLRFDNGICSSKTDDGNEVEVEVEVTWYPEITWPEENREEIGQPELNFPAEDETMFGKLVEVVHTIEDEASSFTKFIMDLRSILAEHPDREVVLELRPLLTKQHAEQPTRWIHVKLQVVEGDEMSSTTLLMRDDNLYVCGFMNRNGILCKLVDNQDNESFLPGGFNPTTDLEVGVSYSSLLQAKNRDDVVSKLTAAQLGSGFAKDAVRVLSSHPDRVAGINLSTEVALAGLIFIVCESARMIYVHKSIEAGWRNGKGFTKQLMDDYVWRYEEMSHKLQAWKISNYGEPHRIMELQATHLVLNSWLHKDYYRLYEDARGQPRVELMAIRAELGVVGTKIIVFDGKRGQIIYKKEEQGEQGGMVDLVLTGPYTGISAVYGCFAIKIDIPGTTPIIWECDFSENIYATKYSFRTNQRVTAQAPSRHDISAPDGRKVAEVTYAVMSSALQVKLQVRLRLKDGRNPDGVSGKITARSEGLEVGSVLFSHTQGMGQCLSPTIDDSWFLLQLERNVVVVAPDEKLCVQVDLQIETSNNQGIKILEAEFRMESGLSSQTQVLYDVPVEVSATWYPEIQEMSNYPKYELSYTIGDDEMSYIAFIMSVRRILADHPDREDILDRHPDSNLSTTRQHPVLSHCSNPCSTPERRLFIKLQVAGEEKTSSITLVIGFDDSTLIRGFRNHKGEYFSWTGESTPYKGLGKTIAEDAVRVLSSVSSSTQHNLEEYNKATLAFERLEVIVCDSASLNPVFDAIASGWNSEAQLNEQLMDYIRNWGRISTALLDWKDSSYLTWEEDKKLEGIGIKSPEDALRINHLCWAGRRSA